MIVEMKYIFVWIVFLAVLLPLFPAEAREIVPRRTWEPVEKTRPIQPFNLKSILEGRKSKGKPLARKVGPVSRNPVDILMMGEDLELTEMLEQSADANKLRTSLRLYDPYRNISKDNAEASMELAMQQSGEAMIKQWEKRNQYYLRKGKRDDLTKEYVRSKTGKTFARDLRRETREREKQERRAEREVRRNVLVGRNGPVERSTNERENPRVRPTNVIVPTISPNSSRSGSSGDSEKKEIRPFFYR